MKPEVDSLSLQEKIGMLVPAGEYFVGGKEAAPFLHDVSLSMDDLDDFGFSIPKINKSDAPRFRSPLEYAKFAEQVHLELLEKSEDEEIHSFWGSDFDNAIGNMVYTMCMENGLDLDADGGQAYCLKATSTEICQYNISRLDAAILRKSNHATPPTAKRN